MIEDDAPLELLDPAQMARADQLAVAGGVSGSALMEAAGAAVAARVKALAPPHGPIAVFCGPGDNGGDGFVAARLLAEAGYEVRLALLGARDRLRGDAALAAERWIWPVVDPGALFLDDCVLAVDALFGAGLSRPLDGEARETVARLADWSRRLGGGIVAVDVPSGLDGASGRPLGAALAATETVTFFRLKPGHLLLPGRELCGRVSLHDIGIPASVLPTIATRTFVDGPRLWLDRFPRPSVAGHKYDRGHAVVVSGDAWRTGAARLAARAALRIGAGLVTLASPADAMAVNAAHLTSVMLALADGPSALAELLADPRKNAVALGPGLGVGSRTRELTAAALARAEKPRSVVLDADALTSFAGRLDDLAALVRGADGPTVLTPHEGEFARLFDEAKGGSKLERARRAAGRAGAVVVLKGADTVVAAPDGRAAIGGLDAPWLATAGSGDVLAGVVAGLLAQGMSGFDAACAAVHLHALAGRRLGAGLISEDLPEALPGALAQVLAAGD